MGVSSPHATAAVIAAIVALARTRHPRPAVDHRDAGWRRRVTRKETNTRQNRHCRASGRWVMQND
jgi:hypothetical protein